MFLVDTQPTLTVQFAPDGTVDDMGTDVTVTVTRADGTALATNAATTRSGSTTSTTYSWTLPVASNTRPDLLRLDWTDTSSSQIVTTYAEIVGSLIFTEAEARAFDNSAMSDTTSYLDSRILVERANVADDLEQWTGRSWCIRLARVELPGTGTNRLRMDRLSRSRRSDGVAMHRPGRGRDINEVVSVTIDGVSVSTSNVVADGSDLLLKSDTWDLPKADNPMNVVVQYTYGYPSSSVKRPALWLLRERLVPSDLNARATSYSDQLGTLRFETPGRNGNVSTIPEVNMWVQRNDMTTLVF